MFSSNTSQVSGGAADPDFENVTMLLHGDGTNGGQNNTFLDASTNNFTITRNGNTTQGSFSPYGPNWSNYFDGSGDYLSFSTTSIGNFGTSDFTVEYWIAPLAQGQLNHLDFRGTGGSGGAFRIGMVSAGFKIASGWDSNDTQLVSTTTPNPSSWTHVAVTRSGTTCRMFINGAQEASVTSGYSFPDNGLLIATYTGSTAYYSGYMSNVRVVKGTAVYTANFTPSTTPLTAISGTSLLTCADNRFIDDSTNNFAITRNGDVSVQRFSPFAPPAAYSTTTIGGSGFFDGSGDYLVVNGSTAGALALPGDFTIETWVYLNSVSADVQVIGSHRFGVNASWVIFLSASRQLSIYYNVGPFNAVSTATVPLRSWAHLAFTRAGSSCRGFINGVEVCSMSNSGSLGTNPFDVSVGADIVGNLPLNGFTASTRVVKGTAVYTANFTPPTAPITAVTNTSLLLNYTNGAIFDNAMMNNLETVGNAQISTSVVKYGTGSMAFDGTGDYLKNVTTPLASLEGNFTIECWLYWTAHADFGGIVSCSNNASGAAPTSGWAFVFFGTTDRLFFESATGFSLQTTNPIPSSQWNHVAVVRSGSTITHYLNGVANGSGTSSSAFNVAPTDNFVIGVDRALSRFTTGYIDDLRITKGVARYTANFTPPTAAFPNL